MGKKNQFFLESFLCDTIKNHKFIVFFVDLGMTPEQVANEAVRMLLYNVNNGGCVDDMLQEQVSCNFQ